VTERLRAAGLRVVIGGRVVIDVADLRAEAGELVVVLGGAGSGKTTLARALAGSVPAVGAVWVDGVVVVGPPSRRRRHGIAAAIRDGTRVVGCSVIEALRLAARGSGRVEETLRRFPQLDARRDVAAHALSGGEQQLLQVAAAWSSAPKVLVLDSPTVGLAADAAASVVACARDEAARGSAVIWLEQDRRAAPAEHRATLSSGSLSERAVSSAPAAE